MRAGIPVDQFARLPVRRGENEDDIAAVPGARRDTSVHPQPVRADSMVFSATVAASLVLTLRRLVHPRLAARRVRRVH